MAIYLTSDRPSRRQPREVIFSQVVVLIGLLLAMLAGFAADAFAQRRIGIIAPAGNVQAGQSTICGHAADMQAPAGTGVLRVQLEVHLRQMAPPAADRWMGYQVVPAVYGHARPDMARAYGQQHLNSGWCATLDLVRGAYLVFARVDWVGGGLSRVSTELSVGSQTDVSIALAPGAALPTFFTLTGAVTDPGGTFVSMSAHALDLSQPDTPYRWIGWLVSTGNGAYASGGVPGGWTVSGALWPGEYDVVIEFVVRDEAHERHDIRRQAVRVRVP
jgi:hypothetical protein